MQICCWWIVNSANSVSTVLTFSKWKEPESKMDEAFILSRAVPSSFIQTAPQKDIQHVLQSVIRTIRFRYGGCDKLSGENTSLRHKASCTNCFAHIHALRLISLFCHAELTIKIWLLLFWPTHNSKSCMVANQWTDTVPWFKNIKRRPVSITKWHKCLLVTDKTNISYRSVQAMYCLYHPFLFPAPFLLDAHPVMNISLSFSPSILGQGDIESNEWALMRIQTQLVGFELYLSDHLPHAHQPALENSYPKLILHSKDLWGRAKTTKPRLAAGLY